MQRFLVLSLFLSVVGCGSQPAPPEGAQGKSAAEAWLKRGNESRNAKSSMGKERAVEAYSEAIRQDPTLEEAYYNRALLYAELGKAKEAVADLKHLQEQRSKQVLMLRGMFVVSAGAQCSMGNAALEKGDFDAALEKYDTALLLCPESAEAHVGRGLVFQKKDRIDDAIAEAEIGSTVGRSTETIPQSIHLLAVATESA